MQNILVLYGGKSVEHDISVITAIQTMNNINKSKYNVIPIYQTKNCEFIVVKDYLNPKIYINKILKYKKVEFVFGKSEIIIKGKISKKIKIDCAINCCHGNLGEDGTLTALMNLCNIPITSASILGSSTCMDKIIMKDVFTANNIPCVKYMPFTKYDTNNTTYLQKIVEKIGYPIIVKPANLGSSIGITKANNLTELKDAIEIALNFDDRVILEECLQDFKEINIACIGNYNCELSMLEQPIDWQDFLNFEDKYTSSNHSKKIMNPDMLEQTKSEIHNFAKQIFKIFNLSGVVRIDFMVHNNKVYVNEINTVPGSLSFYLWKDKYEFFEIIDKLILLAIQKHKQQNMHKYTFSSNVLSDFKQGEFNKYSK